MEPCSANEYLAGHARLLLDSFRRWTGRELLAPGPSDRDTARRLYRAPFAVVSHGTEADPVFNYGNLTALALFELDWGAFTALPSRRSAEPLERSERERLLAAVAERGFVDDYGGVRVSASGKRFRIVSAAVWNLVDGTGRYRGQAAAFSRWESLTDPGTPVPGR